MGGGVGCESCYCGVLNKFSVRGISLSVKYSGVDTMEL